MMCELTKNSEKKRHISWLSLRIEDFMSIVTAQELPIFYEEKVVRQFFAGFTNFWTFGETF